MHWGRNWVREGADRVLGSGTNSSGNVRILLVDDDENVLELLSLYFSKGGFDIITARDGNSALRKVKEERPQLIVLDVMLPEPNGWEVLKTLRQGGDATPVIMLTAKSEDYDKILGLEMGADDYVAKPFNPQEVVARARAVLRRLGREEPGASSRRVIYPGLVVDIDKYEVRVDGKAVPLTRKETELLWLLASNPGRAFTRESLIRHLWGDDYYGDERVVDVHIKRTRAKLDSALREARESRFTAARNPDGDGNGESRTHLDAEGGAVRGAFLADDERPWNIKTVWGVGYKFELNA